MKGIPTYTQMSVAFPHVPRRDEVEDINVSFNAKGGGTHGEFSFVWHDFGPQYLGDKKDRRALKVVAFTDGMNALTDRRILPIIQHLGIRNNDKPEVTPEWMIEKLELAGVRPSTYQLLGLHERTYGKPEFWPKEAKRAYEVLLRHERGD